MGVLDDPEFEPLARAAYGQIDAAASEQNVRLSPFAREIIATWAVSLAYEPETSGPFDFRAHLSFEADRSDFINDVLAVLPTALGEMRGDLPTTFGGVGRRTVRSVDVFHWLADRGNDVIGSSVLCPFEK